MGKVFIDVDKVVDTYNKNNPEKRQLNQKILAELLDCNPQKLTEWKNGNGPKAIKDVIKLAELTGVPVKDFVKIK